MKHRRTFLLSCALTLLYAGLAAQPVWHDPAKAGFPIVQGQWWTGEQRENPYHRFPDRAQAALRPAVWRLSKQCAGESIKFTTSAEYITVRYTVSGNKAMPHMPATGVSGVDLYTKDRHGEEIWIGGKYSFADTITYKFGPLNFGGDTKPHTYTLFLPLYNTVTWMEIGTEGTDDLVFEPLDAEPPIVAYGTSICQGACASRPAMAWTNILQRRLDRTVINLGFSGNAFFDGSVISLIGETDAAAYIIDALPNSHSMTRQMLKDTIVAAVMQLRSVRPNTPILLADHLGYPHSKAIDYFDRQQKHANSTQREAYRQLLDAGVGNLYLLTYEEINLPQDATVEGIHASDYGMVAYADAYEKKLREILDEPTGTTSTTRPVTQSRDFYDWNARHRTLLAQARGRHCPLVLVGNSIIHQWGGIENFPIQRGPDSWNEHMPEGTLNLGCGYDRIENVLWRVYHGELDSITADRIVIMIGTNNLSVQDSDEQIIEGLERLTSAIAKRRPEAEIELFGILPRRGMEPRIKKLNKKIARLAAELKVGFADPGAKLLGRDGRINEKLFADGIHPSREGYERIAERFAGR